MDPEEQQGEEDDAIGRDAQHCAISDALLEQQGRSSCLAASDRSDVIAEEGEQHRGDCCWKAYTAQQLSRRDPVLPQQLGLSSVNEDD